MLFVPYCFECLSVVLACESLHVCTVCIWHCEHARFCVEVFMRRRWLFIHSFYFCCSLCCAQNCDPDFDFVVLYDLCFELVEKSILNT